MKSKRKYSYSPRNFCMKYYECDMPGHYKSPLIMVCVDKNCNHKGAICYKC